jgi:hypothetical protein
VVPPPGTAGRPVPLLELLDADSLRPADLAVTHNLALTPGFHFSPHSTLDRYLRPPIALPPEALDTTVDRPVEAHAGLERAR